MVSHKLSFVTILRQLPPQPLNTYFGINYENVEYPLVFSEAIVAGVATPS